MKIRLFIVAFIPIPNKHQLLSSTIVFVIKKRYFLTPFLLISSTITVTWQTSAKKTSTASLAVEVANDG
ncbi:hypothetical protein, partial [Yersinia massiliensis]|uniref:hypothetical protein n=1 Tax=Yersinia massiliensis TaxID=419257 RepID=UPI001C960075